VGDSLEIVPSGKTLGAEVCGLDLSRPLTPPLVARLRRALIEYCVLLFRGQELTEPEQVRFTGYFGTPAKHTRLNPAGVKTESEIFVVSNVKENGKVIGSLGHGEIDFHSDLAYMAKPGSISLLYALELPPSGSQTQWASAYAAYENLDARTKERIATLRATHVHPTAELNPPTPVAHPVVRRHPESGRLGLFVTPYMTRSIVGMRGDEGDALLSELLAQVVKPEFVWTHEWSPGDVVMWDNRATSHRRRAFPESERRIMKRTQVFGDEIPVGID
tara:strand:+ start:808 stop:1632 length:825 start_codon:yes stop_codon:yes gene_type:complete